jgi:tetratricopeptide (TPR) repeat protein
MRSILTITRWGAVALALCLTGALVGCGSDSSQGKTLDEMMALYQDAWYKPAKAAALQHMDDPKGILVYSLCRVFDSSDLNYEEGLSGLLKLYEDQGLRKSAPLVWAEAGLTYGRVIQVNQQRKKVEGRSQIPAKYDGTDVRTIFADVMKEVPETAQGAMATIYLGETYFRSQEKTDWDTGFEMVEKYLAEQKDKPHTVPVHLYVDVQYVDHRGDYEKSFEHLKAAYELGIVKQVLRRVVLFRLGRTCDFRLHRNGEAKKYYEEFLEKYPFAKETPLVKRYLAEMKGK